MTPYLIPIPYQEFKALENSLETNEIAESTAITASKGNNTFKYKNSSIQGNLILGVSLACFHC